MSFYRFSMKMFMACFLSVAAIACSDSVKDDDDDDDGITNNDAAYTALIDNYVDDVVIPTYADMKDKAEVLMDKIVTFTANPNNVNLRAVANAWLDVRAPWELSEAFLYGPCGENGLNTDPNIDTWPFDMAAFLAKIEGTDPLTVKAISGYEETTRGYHTLEYLIFKDGSPKDVEAEPLSERELQYLESAATVLYYDCVRVWAAWNGLAGLSQADQDAIAGMEQIGYWDVEDYLTRIGTDSYATTFKTAKRPYTSLENVVEEIIDGCRDIATEVAENKLQSPYVGQDVTLVESHYAYNSLVDFVNNVISIENSYNCSRTGSAAANSLRSFVLSKDGGDAIDEEIMNAITNAKEKINKITYPFTNNLQDGVNIEPAIEACSDLDAAFLKIKTLM